MLMVRQHILELMILVILDQLIVHLLLPIYIADNHYFSIIFFVEVEFSNSVTVECNDFINTNNRQCTIELESIE